MRITVAAVCLLMLIAGPAAGQTLEACTFETCALRTQHGAAGVSVVQGLDEEEVARLGLFSFALRDAVAGSDSAVVLALEAERASRWGTALLLGGFVVSMAAANAGLRGGNWAVAGAGIGYGLVVGGSVFRTRGMDLTQEAIWWYNRELAEGRK